MNRMIQKVIKAPGSLTRIAAQGSAVFLAGSIEMGKAEDWQTRLTKALEDIDVTILNPRRDDWDSSWKQTIDNPQFSEQVNWELDALSLCDVIAMYFDPKTQSPISLLELGIFAKTKKLVVFCPEGFWRKGNVDIVCQKYHIDTVDSWEDFVSTVKEKLES
jgi:hypothetical protein